MKRRAALILGLLLVFQLALPPARAAERVYFTAVGSYVLPLSDNTMPFWSGGYVYIASSIFTGTGRESLGISQVLNSDQGRLVLYSGGRSLTYTLSANCALDNDGAAYYPGAIQRNGTVFVPANTVSRYFDLVYSVIEVEHGSMVWLRQPSYGASDKLYADAARYTMRSIYADYIRAKESARPEGGSPGENANPSVPSGSQEPAAGLEGKRIALCLQAGSDASLMADALESYGAGAAFFFTPEEMERQGGTLRRLTAQGQGIGILADADHPDRTVAEQLEAGNAALFRATCGKTRLAYVRGGGAQALQAAGEAGFRCLQPELDRSGYDLRSASGAQELVRRLAAWRGDAAVWLGDGASPAGLRSFLSAAREAGGVCAAYREAGLR
nr:hypothetical protein [uncultured Oscillibacter sp.]